MGEESEVNICCDKKWQTGKGKASDRTVTSKNYKHFSTEQAAKDYIAMNKPCLSVNDAWNFLRVYIPIQVREEAINGFKINVKSKIDNQ